MRRRDVLGSLGTSGVLLSSGCVADSSPLSSSGPSHSAEISLVEQDSVPEDVEFDIHAEVTNATYSDERPAQIEIVVENTGEREHISIHSDDGILHCHLFNRYNARPENTEGLWLYTPDETARFSRKGDRWVQDRPQDERRQWAAIRCSTTPYEAGEAFSQTYQVWHDYRVDGYLNPGTYRWEQSVRVGNSGPDLTTFSWALSIELKSS